MTKINDAIYAKRCVYNLHYHLIWCTKYRNEIFANEELENNMKKILYKVAEDNEIVIENLEVMPDHIHAMVAFPPKKAVTDVVKALKGRSAFIFLKEHPQIVNDKCWGGHLWSPSYYIGSLGNMSKDVVEKYINNQKYNKKK